ncbi:immunity 22 family protein [Xenorhabdus sp. M]|uniref:Immunity 22 family protein n=1 Tax=Xenorhabdus szentirmaii TaxID=290112 RepID=A0AAW3YSF5_9GAMM|nr:immunity 22 family protein [Xenorhabdus sp. M]MBD2800044.1 immunity 22 family protein [Xenorhabdus sp. M]
MVRFESYINQDKYSYQCGFYQDTGQEYDVDTFSSYVVESPIELKALIDEIPFSESYENELLVKCNNLNLSYANCYISILDESFELKDKDKDKVFCRLKFIGVFYYKLPDIWYENSII